MAHVAQTPVGVAIVGVFAVLTVGVGAAAARVLTLDPPGSVGQR